MADIDVHYDPISIDVHPSTVQLTGLDKINSTVTLHTPDTFKTDSRTELVLPQPFKTESTAALDIKPLAVDTCLTLRLDPLPPTCIRQPYHQHLALTLFGIEIIGFALRGEVQTTVSEAATKPHVVWGGQQAAMAKGDGGLRLRLGA